MNARCDVHASGDDTGTGTGVTGDVASLTGVTDGLADTATRHMRCGIALAALGTSDAAVQALAHFDRALELRLADRDRLAHDPVASYDLAATWINRADALVAVKESAGLADAIRSLDAAVAFLERLPLASHRPFAYRLSVALHNRAQFRLRSGRETWRVVPDLFRALDAIALDVTTEGRLAAAAIWATLAEAQAGEPFASTWRRAIESSERALAITATLDSAEPLAVTIGLRARHITCRACLQLLAERDLQDPDSLVLLARLRIASADGVRLAGEWQPRFPGEFEPWQAEFARVCQVLAGLSADVA